MGRDCSRLGLYLLAYESDLSLEALTRQGRKCCSSHCSHSDANCISFEGMDDEPQLREVSHSEKVFGRLSQLPKSRIPLDDGA